MIFNIFVVKVYKLHLHPPIPHHSNHLDPLVFLVCDQLGHTGHANPGDNQQLQPCLRHPGQVG